MAHPHAAAVAALLSHSFGFGAREEVGKEEEQQCCSRERSELRKNICNCLLEEEEEPPIIMTMNKISARSSFGKMNGKQASVGSIAGISRLITKTPALICLLGLVVLMLVIFNSTGDLGGFRQHVRRLQVQEEEEGLAEFTMIRSRRSSSSLPHLLPADNSLRSLKELVKEAMDKGLVIIVNATKADADQLSVDHPRGALPQWDVNAALDGPTGEILTEVIQELHNVEELQKEVAVLRAMQTHCANQTQNQGTKNQNQFFNFKVYLENFSIGLHQTFFDIFFSLKEFFFAVGVCLLLLHFLHLSLKFYRQGWIGWDLLTG